MDEKMMNPYGELKAAVLKALENMSGVYKDANGNFYSEVYKDYRDELEDADIAEILAGRYREVIGGKEMVFEDEPRQCLYQVVATMYREAESELTGEIVDVLANNKVVSELCEKYDFSEGDLRDLLYEGLWYAKLPEEDFLKQAVCMDVVLDTGDANYEFTHNILTESYIESVDDFEEDSSLLWLCEQQGVSREEMFVAIEKGDAHNEEVLGLFQRRKELQDALKDYGFQMPRFRESVIHTGAYREFTRLQKELTDKERQLRKLQANFEKNDMTYEEYLEKHFDRFARLDPMDKETFAAKKAELLNGLAADIGKVKEEIADVKGRLDSKPDYGEIARLQRKIKDVDYLLAVWKLTDVYEKAEFINSVINECNNTYGMAAVTFLVKMTLEEAIRVQEIMDAEADVNKSSYYEEREGKSSIVLDKNVRCGLMDAWQGGGSVFELKLRKDVEIPFKAVDTIRLDRHNGNYGFMSIYGENEESFEAALKEIREVPLEKSTVQEILDDAGERMVVPEEVQEEQGLGMEK